MRQWKAKSIYYDFRMYYECLMVAKIGQCYLWKCGRGIRDIHVGYGILYAYQYLTKSPGWWKSFMMWYESDKNRKNWYSGFDLHRQIGFNSKGLSNGFYLQVKSIEKGNQKQAPVAPFFFLSPTLNTGALGNPIY